MSFYGIANNPRNFSVNDPMFNLQTSVLLLQDQVHQQSSEVVIDTASNHQYTAEELMTGRIVRTGLTGTADDTFVSATEIINALKRKIRSVSDKDTIQNGASIRVQLWNNSNDSIALYSDSANGVLVGGNTNQITDRATAILEIIVNDQESLGSGHTDQVFICVSRCAAAIAPDF